jgi:hypothetical protein
MTKFLLKKTFFAQTLILDYWTSVLFKRLVGPQALTIDGNTSPGFCKLFLGLLNSFNVLVNNIFIYVCTRADFQFIQIQGILRIERLHPAIIN